MVSLIIPCYNEQEVINTTYNRIKTVLINSNIDYEIIFINDGSKDNTLIILSELAKNDTNVKVLSFSRNFGHQPAVTAGISHCKGNMAIIMDADLQDPPELIPQMIEIAEKNNCNVVYGVRINRKGESWFKKFTAKMYYNLLNYLSDVDIPKNTGDFRLIDRKVIDEFKKLGEKK